MIRLRSALSRALSPALLTAFVLAVLSARPAAGEPAKAESRVLTLGELVRMAIAASPELGEARSEVDAAKSDLAQVGAAIYPQLEVTAVGGPTSIAIEPVIVDSRIHDPSPPTELSSLRVFARVDFTVTQPLYTFGKLSNRAEAARRGVRARSFDPERQKGEIALQVKQLYYALILASAGADAAGDVESFFGDLSRRVSKLLELQSTSVTPSDVFRIEAFRADSVRSISRAREGKRLAYFALKSVVGLPANQDFELAEKTLPERLEPPADLESCVQRALSDRAELRQLDEALEAQRSMVEAARSDRYPSFFVAIQGSVAGAPGRDRLENPYIPDEFNHAYAGLVGGVKWDFDFGIGKARVDKSRAEHEKLVYSKQKAEVGIPLQVAKGYHDLVQWLEAADAYRKAAAASRKWVVSALSDFDMGVGTAEGVLTAIEKYGQNQGKHIEALYNYNVTAAELENAVGAKSWE